MKNIIGVDVGGTNIRCAVISKSKGILRFQKEKIKNKSSKENINNQLFDLIDKSFSSKINGIGIAVPAIVDLRNGILYEAYNLPGWEKVPLRRILEKRYKVPVLVNNDANCFALGEKYFGLARNHKDIAGIILGTGFGAGIIINNRLYSGNNCAAGEFGRIMFKGKTIEDYCSGKFFVNEYGISGEKMYEMAKKGTKKALDSFNEYGKNLGFGVSTVINSIDPEVIVLGGSVSKAYNFFKKSLLVSLKKHIYRRVYEHIQIKSSKSEESGVLGAASLFLD